MRERVGFEWKNFNTDKMESLGTEILSFTLQEQRFAIPLVSVERVLRALAVTYIPDAPPLVHGVIDYHGEIVAVINLRNHLKMEERSIQLNDRFIVVNTYSRKLILVVDEVEEVLKPSEKDISRADDINQGLKITNIFRDDRGIIFIYDLEKLLKQIEGINLKEMLESEVTA